MGWANTRSEERWVFLFVLKNTFCGNTNIVKFRWKRTIDQDKTKHNY